MFGIVAYSGTCSARGAELNGLQQLEYRGCDSANTVTVS